MNWPNARELGVQTLYRYEPYPKADAEARGWIDDLLLKGDIYLRTASQFNDPFEARPRFVPPDKDPQRAYYATIKFFRQKQAKKYGLNSRQVREYEKRLTPSALAARRKEMERDWRNALPRNFPMFCLALHPDNLSMWAHYAQSHKGLLVHFDSTRFPFALAQQVRYQKPYPEIPVPPVGLDSVEIPARCLLTKSGIWRREQEFRLIDYPMVDDESLGFYVGANVKARVLDGALPRLGPQRVQIPLDVIKAITLGRQMPAPLKNHLIQLSKNRKPPIEVWQADIEDAAFAMRFERVP